MKLWKSILVGFGTYVVLTFITNLLTYVLAGLTAEYFALGFPTLLLTLFTGVEGFAPVSVELYDGLFRSLLYFPLGTTVGYLQGIGCLLRPIFPGLTAAILAGKIGKTSSNGFFGMLITGILVSAAPIIMLFIDPLTTLAVVPTVIPFLAVPWLMAVIIGAYGLLIGAFWGGLAAFFGRE